MKKSLGTPLKKPVSIWFKPLKADYANLFKGLSSSIVKGVSLKFDESVEKLIEASSAIGLKRDLGETGWLLIYRSISRALFSLIEDNRALIQGQSGGFWSFRNKVELNAAHLREIENGLEWAIDSYEIVVDKEFFASPQTLNIIKALRSPLAKWLEGFGVTKDEATTISERLPAYFLFALHEEWRQRSKDYELLRNALETPFSQAVQAESEWSHYYSMLLKRIDEPLFQESFSLRQIFIPLRAYFEQQSRIQVRDRESGKETWTKKKELIVTMVQEELTTWVESDEKSDVIRIVSGGPGYGKSSIARMFAANRTSDTSRRVLYIPLHLFDPLESLIDAVGNFIKAEGYLSVNPLEDNGQRLLIIFDGLDELSLQGKVGSNIAQRFMKEVKRHVELMNTSGPKIKVLVCGRELAVQTSDIDPSIRILHLLPYRITKEVAVRLKDEKKLLKYDQRDLWWSEYSKVKGLPYKKLPMELNQEDLAEITSLPLLNYLLAFSFTRGTIDFSVQPNLNSIYEDLLDSVYIRQQVWADNQHTLLEDISKDEFFHILEEIAIATWHGDGRKVSVAEIEAQCETSRMSALLEKFKKKAESGVADLLVAFYFRKSSVTDTDGNETFEFTHKSFGEYLTSRRLIRGVKRIVVEVGRREKDYDSGWDEKDCLGYWINLSRHAPMDAYLLTFVRREISLNPVDAYEWQNILSRMVAFILRYGIPMEKTEPRGSFYEEIRQARNSEESLLAIVNACALVTKQLSRFEIDDNFAMNGLLLRLGENGALVDGSVFSDILSVTDFSNYAFTVSLVDCNLSGSKFENADLSDVNLSRAVLTGTDLQGANFRGANLARADLTGANATGANFSSAFMAGARLVKMTVDEADFNRAVLITAVTSNTIFDDAYVENALFTKDQIDFTDEDLEFYQDFDEIDTEDFDDIPFYELNFRDANLSYLDFSSANLTRANFNWADFYRGDFRCANFENADFTGASFEGAKGLPENEE